MSHDVAASVARCDPSPTCISSSKCAGNSTTDWQTWSPTKKLRARRGQGANPDGTPRRAERSASSGRRSLAAIKQAVLRRPERRATRQGPRGLSSTPYESRESSERDPGEPEVIRDRLRGLWSRAWDVVCRARNVALETTADRGVHGARGLALVHRGRGSAESRIRRSILTRCRRWYGGGELRSARRCYRPVPAGRWARGSEGPFRCGCTGSASLPGRRSTN